MPATSTPILCGNSAPNFGQEGGGVEVQFVAGSRVQRVTSPETHCGTMTKRLRLDAKWTDKLCRLPESGMGYQRVDVRLRNGQCVRDVIVFNAEELEWPRRQPIESDDIVNISPTRLDSQGP